MIDYYLQYQPEEIKQYVKKFDYRYTDLQDIELVILIDMLIDAADVYSQHKFDVRRVRQKFHVTLKANSELKKQRPSKVPLHLKDKLEKLLGQLQEADIIREMGDDDELGSFFVNTIILLPKANYVKLVINARYLNSEFCADLQPHTHSENNLRNKSLDRLPRPQLSSELLSRENEFKSIYSSTYKRCGEITSKAHEYRNRFKLGRPLEVGQKVLLENHKPNLFKPQKMKHLRVGPFTVTKQITNITYVIKQDENPENVKVTHRNHLLEYIPKEETLPPLLTNYAPIEQDDNFYKHLVQSQIDKHNSGQSGHELGFMPLIITPFQGRIPTFPKTLKFPAVLTLDSSLQKPHNFTPRFRPHHTMLLQENTPLNAVDQIHIPLCKHHDFR